MGTNYYVQRPTKCIHGCCDCGTSLNESVHLGKSSAGNSFMFRAQEDFDPEDSLNSWITLANSGPIQDEYGDEIPFKQLWHRIIMADGQGNETGYDSQGHNFYMGEFS